MQRGQTLRACYLGGDYMQTLSAQDDSEDEGLRMTSEKMGSDLFIGHGKEVCPLCSTVPRKGEKENRGLSPFSRAHRARYTPHVPPKPIVTLPPSRMTGTLRPPLTWTIRASSFASRLTLT